MLFRSEASAEIFGKTADIKANADHIDELEEDFYRMMAKKTKQVKKPQFDPEFYHEDGWPKLPDFLNRKLQNDLNSKRNKSKKSIKH